MRRPLFSRSLKLLCLSLTGLTVLPSLPTPAAADDGFYGQVYMTAAYCRRGSLELKGQTLSKDAYGALFSLLGNAYGGDGRNDFSIPDMRSRSPVGVGQSASGQTISRGGRTGSDFQTLEQVPSHDHSVTSSHTHTTAPHTHQAELKPSTSAQNVPDPKGHAFSTSTSGPLYAASATPTLPMADGSVSLNLSEPETTGTADALLGPTGVTGQGQPIDVRDPFTGIKFCIITEGDYPSRQ